MASEKGSSVSGEPLPQTSYVLDERRRAALAEVDNAKFSYVFVLSSLFPCPFSFSSP